MNHCSAKERARRYDRHVLCNKHIPTHPLQHEEEAANRLPEKAVPLPRPFVPHLSKGIYGVDSVANERLPFDR